MSRLLGDLLKETVPLTLHDVEEVLAEQRTSRMPFGQQAIELGLCTPHDLWLAFARQLEEGPREVDLNVVGIDAQALSALPADLAIRHQVLPVRLVDGIMVLATTPDNLSAARTGLAHELGTSVPLRFVVADEEDLHRSLALCYGDGGE
jgi:type IV pilus assembly protein PilB